VTGELEELAMQDRQFRGSRVKIGTKGFSTKVNMTKEAEAMKKKMRKITDKSGLGFSEGNTVPLRKRDEKLIGKDSMLDHKAMREAQIRLNGEGEGMLEDFQNSFKQTVKVQFLTSFVPAGQIENEKKEATVTFLRKGSKEREVVPLREWGRRAEKKGFRFI